MKHLPNIEIKVIDHKKHRYETVGDYFKKNKSWQFRVSKMNYDYEMLVIFHELVEWFLTQKRGISEKGITNFDVWFESKRKAGNIDEPGHDKKAPYHKEHVFAEKIEKLIAKEIGVDWKKYDNTVNTL